MHTAKQPMVYIMTNRRYGTIYTGVTARPRERIYEHKTGIGSKFTQRHGCKILVYYEWHNHMTLAIEREKQLKAGSRKDKTDLIDKMNPTWEDLYHHFVI